MNNLINSKTGVIWISLGSLLIANLSLATMTEEDLKAELRELRNKVIEMKSLEEASAHLNRATNVFLDRIEKEVKGETSNRLRDLVNVEVGAISQQKFNPIGHALGQIGQVPQQMDAQLGAPGASCHSLSPRPRDEVINGRSVPVIYSNPSYDSSKGSRYSIYGRDNAQYEEGSGNYIYRSKPSFPNRGEDPGSNPSSNPASQYPSEIRSNPSFPVQPPRSNPASQYRSEIRSNPSFPVQPSGYNPASQYPSEIRSKPSFPVQPPRSNPASQYPSEIRSNPSFPVQPSGPRPSNAFSRAIRAKPSVPVDPLSDISE